MLGAFGTIDVKTAMIAGILMSLIGEWEVLFLFLSSGVSSVVWQKVFKGEILFSSLRGRHSQRYCRM